MSVFGKDTKLREVKCLMCHHNKFVEVTSRNSFPIGFCLYCGHAQGFSKQEWKEAQKTVQEMQRRLENGTKNHKRMDTQKTGTIE